MAIIKPSQLASGSYTISGSFSGSFQGAVTGVISNAISASYALTASNAQTASYVQNVVSASFAATASYAENVENIFLRNQTRINTTESIIFHQSIFNPFNLEILTSSIFIIDSTSEYYVLGDLTNKGQIVVDGTLKIGGALYNSGSIIGNGIIV